MDDKTNELLEQIRTQLQEAKGLTKAQKVALLLATKRKTGRVAAGDGYKAPASTLRSLTKLGLLKHIGTRTGTMGIGRRILYQITDEGREAAKAFADDPALNKEADAWRQAEMSKH